MYDILAINLVTIPDIFFEIAAELSPIEHKIYISLCFSTFNPEEESTVLESDLIEKTRLSRSSIVKSTKNLVNLNLIKKIKIKDSQLGSYSNIYYKLVLGS